MSKEIGLFVGFVLITLLGTSCVVIPVPPPEEKPFQDVHEWLTVGESTIDIVSTELDTPTLKGFGWLLYREPHEGWGWMICAAGPYSAGCSPSLRGKTSGRFLLVEFDGQQVVTDVDFLAEVKLCEDRQICYSGEFLMSPAAAAAHIEAKNFLPPTDGCSVYTYSQTDSDLAAGELIINGKDAGGLVGRSAFYRHVVPPGLHEWRIAPSQSGNLPLPAAVYDLECQGREVIFLRYKYGLNTFWFNKIEVVDLKRGKDDLVKRWLAISTM